MATGSKRLAPNIEGLTKFEGKGVSYCAVCDAFFTETKTSAFSAPANTLCTRPKFSQKHQKALPCSQTAKSRRQYFPQNLQLLKNRCRLSQVTQNRKSRFARRHRGQNRRPFRSLRSGIIGSSRPKSRSGDNRRQNQGQRFYDDERKRPFAAGDCTGGLLQVSKAVGDGAAAGMAIIKYVKREK